MTKQNETTEYIWLDCSEWLGYQVSNKGEVKSIDRVIICSNGQKQLHKGMLLKQHDRDGYLYARMRCAITKRSKMVSIHRLVAKAFLGEKDNCNVINHLDCNTKNNKPSNLEWCTQKQNIEYMDNLGRRRSFNWETKPHKNQKLTKKTVLDIVKLSKNLKVKEISKITGVERTTVGRIINGKSYKIYTQPLPNKPKEK